MVKNQPIDIRRFLNQSGFKAKKSLGQHFLVDNSFLDTIISAADIATEDIVIEIGPGLGTLTMELAKKAGRVIAVELDDKLASLLKKNLSYLTNTMIINDDILELDPVQLIKDKKSYKVVANIPYYITSPILQHFIGASLKPSLMVVMVQKEVGESIVAEPGDLSVLAISLQIYSKPKIIAHVPAKSFYPPPKVDSVILRFDILPEPAINIDNIDCFLDFVKCGFSSPRKQLRNSLAQGLRKQPAEVATLLETTGIEPQRRAESLNLEEWKRLYDFIKS